MSENCTHDCSSCSANCSSRKKESMLKEPHKQSKIKKVIGVIVMFLYRIRSVFLAIPVVYYALKIAAYNTKHLPKQVGLVMNASGEFAYMISRNVAVMGPLILTGGCLVMMFCSRKALFPWAVSLFTVVLPILLLVSNLYPA